MKNLLALVLILALSLLVVPAGAQEVNGPCANPKGLPVVTLAAGQTADVAAPEGLLAQGPDADLGTYLIDLEGLPVGAKKTVDFVLSWTNGVFDEVTDYDMDINGVRYNSSATSESASVSLGHCKTIGGTADSYIGTPADTLTVNVSISQFGF